MSQSSATKSTLIAILSALFALLFFVAQSSDAVAQSVPTPGATTAEPGHDPGHGPGGHGPNGPAARPNANHGPAPLPPSPPAGPRPGHKPPPMHHHHPEVVEYTTTTVVCNTPECEYDSYVGGVIGGVSTMILGLAIGIPSLIPSLWDEDSFYSDDPYADASQDDVRMALGISGLAIVAVGAIVTGIYGHKIATWDTSYGELQLSPTLGGASLKFTF